MGKPDIKRNGKLAKADSIFNDLLNEMGQDSEFNRRFVLFHWKEIVGDFWARHVRVVKLVHKKLYLTADSGVWADEIKLHQIMLRDKINQYAGSDMVREIFFTGESLFREAYTVAADEDNAPKELDFGKTLKAMRFTDEEISRIKENTSAIQDDDLRLSLERWYGKNLKLNRLKLHNNWHYCPKCNHLTSPEAELCFSCRRQQRSDRREAIRRILEDEPWAKYKDIYQRVECNPDMVNEQRLFMIQCLLPYIDVEHPESLEAQRLTMLFKEATPEEVRQNPKLVLSTFYTLRYDIGANYFDYHKKRKKEKEKQRLAVEQK